MDVIDICNIAQGNVLEEVCVKEEFDFDTKSVAVCENEDYECIIDKIKKETNDVKYETETFVDDLSVGHLRNSVCIRNIKSDLDDLKEELFEESSCSTDSFELNYVVKTEKTPLNKFYGIKIEETPESNFSEPNGRRKNEAAYLFCDTCSFSTRYRGHLIRHIRCNHMPRLFKCSICKTNYQSIVELRQHRLDHKRPKRSYPFECCFCKFRTDNKNKMSEHIFRIHVFDLPEGEFSKAQQCYVCRYESSNKMEFLTHFIDNHHVLFLKGKSKGPVHACKLCDFSTYGKNTLCKHIEAVHMRIRPYACHLCNYAANKRTDLRIHLSAKHEQIKPFKCVSCNFSSAYKRHVRSHMRTQHEMKKKRIPHVRRCDTKKNK